MGKPRKRTNGAGTGIARPNGRFTAQITHPNGRRRSIGTFPTRVETEKALAVVMSKARRRSWSSPSAST